MRMDTRSLLRSGTLDADLVALLWLLTEGGVPLVVAGIVDAATRAGLAAALLSLHPGREWVVLDADAEPLTPERLTAMLRSGVGLGVSVGAGDLGAVLDRLVAAGLPEDGARRLGVVIIACQTPAGLRCLAVHYLRPAERDAVGHVQRRPPAVLAAWDGEQDTYEHYAWGITPELADRVDRSQADFEERHHDRSGFLQATMRDVADAAVQDPRVTRYLQSEPPRRPAPPHQRAKPSPLGGGLTDPEAHVH